MTSLSIEEFLHNFRQEILANAEANMDFLEVEFTQNIADELIDSGVIDGFELGHHRSATGGMRVDGYWFNDNSLDLFISDFANRETVQSLARAEISLIFKRLENFFTSSAEKNLYLSLEETSHGYDLARNIADRCGSFSKVNFFLFSERVLSTQVKELEDKHYNSWNFSYNIWDLSRLHRLQTSRGAREELEINFAEMIDPGLPCLPAHLDSATYKSYLVVMPAKILADLYGKYGPRLLEQNVRSFLQVRGNVNKGIRLTIMKDPEMFFAYNNGITATARHIEIVKTSSGFAIASLKDLQIVNGGQTTASLFHTNRKDKASLENIFVQMKLSVIDEEKSEEIIPQISEYANTQNKVNAADFFSNHPFHIRMEEFSRRLWVPAQQGSQRETKWFYERARGQYTDAQAKLTATQKKRFEAEYPKTQMFTKTDLAKFENVWEGYPISVNQGAQKNFSQYVGRVGQEWEKKPDQFNEFFFKRAIARAIIFRRTEKIVSAQSWYNGGYRANVVAYTIAMLSKICSRQNKSFDFLKVWHNQEITQTTIQAIEVTAKLVYNHIMHPTGNISNISEWCKKEACWITLQEKLYTLEQLLPVSFFEELAFTDQLENEARSSAKTQKMLNGIEAQKIVVGISGETWAYILAEGQEKGLFSIKEQGILQIAARLPEKIPSEKQSLILIDILEKAKLEAIYQK
ncbi:AIPR family protein [Herpetosiphon llansteffanensis]|uniref:AIPR family protein n=1 Tax=Herpetosiphon llansteffanensis TaxID=2094568 RepID=UPI000D7BBDAC|nr:AIPR family protein [Herpetosiphon llansteffanensis]